MNPSPGAYVKIEDFSMSAQNLATGILGIVTTARKGPMNTLTLVTSEAQRQSIFGSPSADHLGQFCLQRFLRKNGMAWVVRVGTYQTNPDDLVFKDGADADVFTVSIPADVGPGSWANGFKVELKAGTAASTYKLVVSDASNQILETHDSLVLTPSTSANYIETRVNAASAIISVTVDDGTKTPVLTTKTFANGDDGSPVDASDIIGVAGLLPTTDSTGLQLFRNPERVAIDILIAPGFSDPAVVAELNSIQAARGDCIAIPDLPDNLTVAEGVDWTNGVGSDNPPASLNSADLTVMYPWVKIFDPVSNGYVWIPPSGHYASAMAQTLPWLSCAGLNRGILEDVVDIRHAADQGERDYMVSNGNCLNMIAKFPGAGIAIWSALTTLRSGSLRNHVNVERLLLYAKKLVRAATLYLVHEQNDEDGWQAYKNLLNPIMESIQQNRGLTSFRVVCDASTQQTAKPNTMFGYVEMQPTPEADRIISTFAIYNGTVTFQ